MPIIVSAVSLARRKSHTHIDNVNKGKSLIYYPTAKCSCAECNVVSAFDRTKPSPAVDDISIDITSGAASPRSRQSISSLDESSSLEAVSETFTCMLCSLKFPTRKELECHNLIHSTEKSYKCQQCDRHFTWFGNFQKHMLSHGSENARLHPYFTLRDIPEDQLFIRENNKTFKCGLCLKTFTRMSGLRTHIRMHNGQRPFKCKDCTLAFTTNRALKMHNRIHSGERPYKCTECIKSFTRKDELQAHLYLHKGKRKNLRNLY